MELHYKVDIEISKKHKRLISFSDYDVEKDINNASVLSACVELEKQIRDYCESHTNWSEEQIQEDLKKFNKIYVELFQKYLLANDMPSTMISGRGNYNVARHNKKMVRQNSVGQDLWGDGGKIERAKESILKKYNKNLLARKIKQIENAKEFKEFEVEVNKHDLISYGNDVENARVYLKFNGKPGDETITVLKKNAFKWSPKNKRWQRQTTANGVSGLKKVLATYEIEINNF